MALKTRLLILYLVSQKTEQRSLIQETVIYRCQNKELLQVKILPMTRFREAASNLSMTLMQKESETPIY